MQKPRFQIRSLLQVLRIRIVYASFGGPPLSPLHTPCASAWKLQAVSRALIRLSSSVSLLPGITTCYLKTVVSDILPSFLVFTQQVNPVPMTPPWPEAEVAPKSVKLIECGDLAHTCIIRACRNDWNVVILLQKLMNQ